MLVTQIHSKLYIYEKLQEVQMKFRKNQSFFDN